MTLILILLALAILTTPAAMLYLKVKERWQLRKWRREYMRPVLPMRKR